MESLTFIIPAYNDEATIRSVVQKTVGVGKKLRIPFDIVAIDDASVDATGHMLSKLARRTSNLRVIMHKKNAGYGKTIKELYQKAQSAWLFSLPGDYQIDPGELHTLWRHRQPADMIIGWRRTRRDSPARLRQSRVYNALLHVLFGTTVHDVNSVRLMKTSIMKSVTLGSSSAFVDAELVIRSMRAGFHVIEIPIAHRARAGAGASGGKLNTILPTIFDMVSFWVNSI